MPSRTCAHGTVRTRRRPPAGEVGFTLVELLIVMIIIGVLASIAVPIFLSQRSRGRDTSTKADVSRVGKEVATFYVDGAGPLTLDTTTVVGSATLKSGAAVVTSLKLSNGTALRPVAYRATSGSESSTWCVAMTNPNGANQTYSYSARAGLGTGDCP